LPVRIYALAKELKLDTKQLVDICSKAGIPGKGSALASLTDEEAVKVKAFISGGAKPAQPKAPPATAPGPPRPAEPEVVRREDYIAPSGSSGKMPVLKDTGQKKSDDVPRPPSPKPAAARTSKPAIKLAPMPATDQPPPPEVSDEPAPQKPDLKLPVDAIRASKAGSKPLAEHLRRQESKRRDDAQGAAAKPRARGNVAPADRPPLGGALRGRGRKGKSSEYTEEKSEDGKPLLGGREQRQLNRKRSRTRRTGDEDERGHVSRARRIKRTGTNTAAPRKGKVTLQLPCTVRAFSEATGCPAPQILRVLLSESVVANVNTQLDPEMTELIAAELGVEVELRQPKRLEDDLHKLLAVEDDPQNQQLRPPVVTFLGHVDHGKTSLLDRILTIDVASGESGGITQHIRAYQVEKDGRRIAFVDTPGHEAFTEMRARGANVTDIAVLVVAADDGVMPQTEEAISHARAAEVPIVVALNKIDLPGVDVNRVMQELSTNELLPSEWGGDVEVVKTSATTGEGLDELLETLLTVAELHDYKANPERHAYGTCLEAQQEGNRGVVAKLMVQNGALHVGDIVVCGEAFGRIKAMYDTLHPSERLDEVGPSTPANVTGLDVAPEAGERFYVLEDIGQARQIAQERADFIREEHLGRGGPSHVTLETLFERLEGDEEVRTLNLIIRADVRGSLEAIDKEIGKLDHPEVKIRVLQQTVGGITEADVHLANASDAVILGFNVVPDEGARKLADRFGVQIRRYEVIYKVTDDLKKAVEGLLKPEEREVDLGRALVQRTFTISRIGTVAGCRVLAGNIQRNSRVRVIRNNTVIGNYPLDSLKREKDDAREVREGMECGIKLAGFNDVKEGDVLEAYKVEEVERTFEAR